MIRVLNRAYLYQMQKTRAVKDFWSMQEEIRRAHSYLDRESSAKLLAWLEEAVIAGKHGLLTAAGMAIESRKIGKRLVIRRVAYALSEEEVASYDRPASEFRAMVIRAIVLRTPCFKSVGRPVLHFYDLRSAPEDKRALAEWISQLRPVEESYDL